MSAIRHAIPQVQQETTMVLHVALMFFSLFEYNFNNNCNPIKQQTYEVHLYTSYSHPHTIHYIYVNFIACILSYLYLHISLLTL
jgi:hypothetical protein